MSFKTFHSPYAWGSFLSILCDTDYSETNKNNSVQNVYVMRKLLYTQRGYADILFTHSCLSKAPEKSWGVCEIMTQNLEALYLILNTDGKKVTREANKWRGPGSWATPAVLANRALPHGAQTWFQVPAQSCSYRGSRRSWSMVKKPDLTRIATSTQSLTALPKAGEKAASSASGAVNSRHPQTEEHWSPSLAHTSSTQHHRA